MFEMPEAVDKRDFLTACLEEANRKTCKKQFKQYKKQLKKSVRKCKKDGTEDADCIATFNAGTTLVPSAIEFVQVRKLLCPTTACPVKQSSSQRMRALL